VGHRAFLAKSASNESSFYTMYDGPIVQIYAS